MKFSFKDIGKYIQLIQALLGAMNGKKLNTGAVMLLVVFVMQQIGIPESEAKEIFANGLVAFGSVLTLWGYIHRLIKANQAKAVPETK